MFDLYIDERKRYNRVVLIGFIIGCLIGVLMAVFESTVDHHQMMIESREAMDEEVREAWEIIAPLPEDNAYSSFPLPFVFFPLAFGWMIGGVAGGVWLGWRVVSRTLDKMKISLIIRIIFSPFLIWLSFAITLPSFVAGVPYAIYNIIMIRRYEKCTKTDEMTILEMNVYGKKEVFMYKLFKEHVFDELLFEAYFDELKILNYQIERKEMLKLVARRNDEILSMISNHYLPDNPLVIENMPANISHYIGKIKLENQRLINML